MEELGAGLDKVLDKLRDFETWEFRNTTTRQSKTSRTRSD